MFYAAVTYLLLQRTKLPRNYKQECSKLTTWVVIVMILQSLHLS